MICASLLATATKASALLRRPRTASSSACKRRFMSRRHGSTAAVGESFREPGMAIAATVAAAPSSSSGNGATRRRCQGSGHAVRAVAPRETCHQFAMSEKNTDTDSACACLFHFPGKISCQINGRKINREPICEHFQFHNCHSKKGHMNIRRSAYDCQTKPRAWNIVPEPRGHLALQLLPPPIHPVVVYDEAPKLPAS